MRVRGLANTKPLPRRAVHPAHRIAEPSAGGGNGITTPVVTSQVHQQRGAVPALRPARERPRSASSVAMLGVQHGECKTAVLRGHLCSVAAPPLMTRGSAMHAARAAAAARSRVRRESIRSAAPFALIHARRCRGDRCVVVED